VAVGKKQLAKSSWQKAVFLSVGVLTNRNFPALVCGSRSKAKVRFATNDKLMSLNNRLLFSTAKIKKRFATSFYQ
jgi:hypothetical protein